MVSLISVSSWIPAVRCQIKRLHDFAWLERFFFKAPSTQPSAAGKLLIEGFTINDMEGLSKVRLRVALAVARGGALRTTEGIQKIGIHRGVRQLQCPRSFRKSAKERRRLGHLRDGIENHFGGQTSGKVVREISIVVHIGGIRSPRALIGSR